MQAFSVSGLLAGRQFGIAEIVGVESCIGVGTSEVISKHLWVALDYILLFWHSLTMCLAFLCDQVF